MAKPKIDHIAKQIEDYINEHLVDVMFLDSKKISDELNINIRTVGQALSYLASKNNGFKFETWSESCQRKTYKIERA